MDKGKNARRSSDADARLVIGGRGYRRQAAKAMRGAQGHVMRGRQGTRGQRSDYQVVEHRNMALSTRYTDLALNGPETWIRSGLAQTRIRSGLEFPFLGPLRRTAATRES